MSCSGERNVGLDRCKRPCCRLSEDVHPTGGQGAAEANIGITDVEWGAGIFPAVPSMEEVTS